MPPIRLVVLDLVNTPSLNLAGIDLLTDLQGELEERGVAHRVAGATGNVRDALRAAGVANQLGLPEPGSDVDRVIRDWQATDAEEVPAAPTSPE